MAEDRDRAMSDDFEQAMRDGDRTGETHVDWCPCRICRPELAAEPIRRFDDRGWHYLIRFPDGTVVQCAGDWDVAHKHLRLIRADWSGDTVPTLIGCYPPNSVGGPEGHGGIVSLGYTPNLIGNIDVPREDWIPA